MQIFENYRREYKVVSATVASILTTFLIDKYASQFKSDGLAYSTIIIAVVLIVLIGNYVLDYVIDDSVQLRKLLMGKDFIEGYWYDLSIDKPNKAIKHGVLFKISYEKGNYVLHGITYNRQGDRIATWKSISCTFFDKILFVQYESHTDYSATFIEHGVLQIHFETPANSYTGFYFDFSNSIRFIISGRKVSKEETRDYNGFNDIVDKEKFLMEVMHRQETKPHF
jgi:uncharacterized membrane protein YwzB